MISIKNLDSAVSFDGVINRLKNYLMIEQDQDIAEKIGLKRGAFYTRRKSGSIPFDHIINALKDTDANLEYIFYGIGDDKIKQKLKLDNDAPIGNIAIRYFDDVSASAGYGCLNGDHCEYETVYVDRNLLPKATSKNIEAIRVFGDSMHPTISEGDTIFVDKSQRDIRNGKIFIIRINDEVFVKRIFISPYGLIVKSDNPDYPQFDIKKDQADILGQVIYTMEYHG